MKAFDVEKALAGEPVRLKNCAKAIIFGRIPEGLEWSHIGAVNHPLAGVILNAEGRITDARMRWSMSGVVDSDDDEKRAYDIIGMWEDDNATIIERAVKEDLPVRLRGGTKAWVLAVASSDYYHGDFPVLGHDSQANYHWTKEGRNYLNGESSRYDIVGLWEDKADAIKENAKEDTRRVGVSLVIGHPYNGKAEETE